MLDKFTEKALKAVISSQEEAKRLMHPLIGTEHLLLGLIKESSGIPSRVLKAVGITQENLSESIIKITTSPKNVSGVSEVSFSNQAIKALQIASDKAKSLGYIYVGSEHILIALLGSDNFGSVMALKDLGVDLDRIKETVTRITAKRSLNRAHPEIQASKKLTEITKAVQSRFWDIPFSLEHQATSELISFSQEEIHKKNMHTIGSEQLILAMLRSESSSLKGMLEEEGLNYDKVIEYLNNNPDRSSEYEGANYQMTPVAYRALELAHEISTDLGYGLVKPEHVLLGLLKENKGVALNILKETGVNPSTLYKKIVYPIEQKKPPTLSIIKLAKEEASRLEYNVVGSEHILLGLLCVGLGKAARVLNELGVTLKDTRQEVERVIGYGEGVPDKEMTFTPRAKRLLEVAWEEAKKSGSKRIESEHLLLAIIRQKDCMAMQVLTALGVDSIEIKQGIMDIIEKENGPEPEKQSQEEVE